MGWKAHALWILGYTLVICPLSLLKIQQSWSYPYLFLCLTTHIQVLCSLHTKLILTINISYHLYLCHSTLQTNFSFKASTVLIYFMGISFSINLPEFSLNNETLSPHLLLPPSTLRAFTIRPLIDPLFILSQPCLPISRNSSFLLILEWEALLVTGIFTLCSCVLKYNFLKDHFSGHLIKKNQFDPHDLLFSILFPTIFSIKTLFPKYSEIWTHVTYTCFVHTYIYCYLGNIFTYVYIYNFLCHYSVFSYLFFQIISWILSLL